LKHYSKLINIVGVSLYTVDEVYGVRDLATGKIKQIFCGNGKFFCDAEYDCHERQFTRSFVIQAGGVPGSSISIDHKPFTYNDTVQGFVCD